MPPADRSNDVYETLLSRIISWDLMPGTALSEVDLAAQMSVSRTPIRQALARLRRDGLITQAAGQSASVSAVSVEAAVEFYQAREALEPYALMLAARSRRYSDFASYCDRFEELATAKQIDADDVYAMSRRFDREIHEACDNTYLVKLLEELALHTARLRNLARGDETRLRASMRQRMSVASAVARGDGPEAARLESVRLADSLAVVIRELVGSTVNPARHEPLSIDGLAVNRTGPR